MTRTNQAGIGSRVELCLMGALAMSFGWGFRGDYGHEAGAMVPGVLMAMGVCLCSGRTDWFRRCAVIGLFGALGWAFGGQMSYGQITSYTVSHLFPDVYYGYACLFVVGALWGGIGGAILAFALTKARSELDQFMGPILAVCAVWFAGWILFWLMPDFAEQYETFTAQILHDTDWLPATLALAVAGVYWALVPKARPACTVLLLMAAGWWLGYLILVRFFDLHMSPKPGGEFRSDNWAGCAGLFAALLLHEFFTRNRAGVMLTLYGALAGGIGFSVGDFINKPDKVRWEPFWCHEWLRGFDHWKWTEQSFGFMMGFGVALGLLRLLRGNLAAPAEDEKRGRLDDFSVFVLLIPMMWMNLRKNVRNWARPDIQAIPDEKMLGLPVCQWFLLAGVLISLLVLYVVYRHRRGTLPLAPQTALGKGQLLFLFILWVAEIGVLLQAFPHLKSKGVVFVHASFWLTGIVCTWLVLRQGGGPVSWSMADSVGPDDARWRLGWMHWLAWASVPLLIAALTSVTISMHDEPMPGHRIRFGPEATHKLPPQ